MPDPIHTIVDVIPVPDGAAFFEVFGDSIYCAHPRMSQVDVATKTVRRLGDGIVGCIAVVDFHRPIDAVPDIIGAGQPDRRIYVALEDGSIGEYSPPLLHAFRQFRSWPSSDVPFIGRIVGAHSAKYLYFHDWNTYTIGIMDIDRPDPRTLGSIQLEDVAWDMVVSPDDRFIYASHWFQNLLSVVDTSRFPPSVQTHRIPNGPTGLALSADGKRLFVAQCGDSGGDPSDLGTGTLSVLDTSTMQGSWLYTGDWATSVVVNAAGTRAYVSNSHAHTVSAVDVTGDPAVIDTISGFTDPATMRFSVDERRLYVAEQGGSPRLAVAAI